MATSSNKFRRVWSHNPPDPPASSDNSDGNGSETQGGNSDGGKSGKFNWDALNTTLGTLGDVAVSIWGNTSSNTPAPPASSGKSGDNTALYVGIGAGALVLVLIIVLVRR